MIRLVDQGRDYAEALKIAGVPVLYRCYEHLAHAFTAMSGAIPRRARRAERDHRRSAAGDRMSRALVSSARCRTIFRRCGSKSATLAPPAQGEVKVRLRAASVNFPDILMMQGKYQLKPDLPFSPGMEGAGEVIAVGEGVARVKVGDEVVVGVALRLLRGRDRRAGSGACAPNAPWRWIRRRRRLSGGVSHRLCGAWCGAGSCSAARRCWCTARRAASAWRRSISGKLLGATVIATASGRRRSATFLKAHGARSCASTTRRAFATR